MSTDKEEMVWGDHLSVVISWAILGQRIEFSWHCKHHFVHALEDRNIFCPLM
jgi:hypothetical protein